MGHDLSDFLVNSSALTGEVEARMREELALMEAKMKEELALAKKSVEPSGVQALKNPKPFEGC